MDDNERKMLLLKQIDEKLGSIIAVVVVIVGIATYFHH